LELGRVQLKEKGKAITPRHLAQIGRLVAFSATRVITRLLTLDWLTTSASERRFGLGCPVLVADKRLALTWGFVLSLGLAAIGAGVKLGKRSEASGKRSYQPFKLRLLEQGV